MPALSAFVTTTTQSRLLPKSVDQVIDSSVLSMRLFRQSKTWRGGTSIDIAVNLSDITAFGSYSGFDVLSTTQENTRQRASFTPSQLYMQVAYSGIQKAVNSGDAAVLDLIGEEIAWRTKRLGEEFGNQIYTDGTGNTSKDILGLLAYVDDSTSVTTYAGLSRATYTSWRATRTAQSGSLSLANLASDFNVGMTAGEAPTIIVAPLAVFNIYEALLTPTVSHQYSMNDYKLVATEAGGTEMVRVGGTVAAGNGFRALTFRGIPFVGDPKATTGNIFTLNENHLSFYTIPQPDRQIKNGFAWTGFREPANQDAFVAYMLWYGQLVGDAPRLNARRTGVIS